MVGLPVPTKDELPIEESVEETVNQPNEETQVKSDSEDPLFTLAINKFSFTDTSHINFTDQSIVPHYVRDFNITTFTAGPFDNQKPQQESHFALKGGSNKYASFDLSDETID